MARRDHAGRRTVAVGTAATLVVALLAATSAASVAPAHRWRPIAAAPIEGRIGAAAVWTGDAMLVWGGVTRGRDGSFTVNRDGAAYDPVTDTWRRIRNAPAGVRGGGGSAAAWTGDVAIVWAGNSPDGPARGAVYDPAADAWRKLPQGPLGPREGYVSAWTGDELLIVGGTSGDGFASPVAAGVTPDGRWRPLPALNALEALIPSGAVWGSGRAFVTGTRYLCPELGSTCTDTERLVLAYDPATDAATPLEPPTAAGLRAVGWTGTEVAFVRSAPRPRIFLYDPATDAWREGARAPCAVEGSTRQIAWLGDRLVESCGDRRLQVYDVASDAWSTIRAGRSVFDRFAGSAIVWTGRRLIVWSGVANRRFNPTPNLGERITLRG